MPKPDTERQQKLNEVYVPKVLERNYLMSARNGAGIVSFRPGGEICKRKKCPQIGGGVI
jgi:hypothetical protein